MHTLGAKVTLVAPPTLIPNNLSGWPAQIDYNLDNAIEDADVVMMLRVQQERMQASYFPSIREYSRRYGLDISRVNKMHKTGIVMHPGPMNRGIEISSEIADSARSMIVQQVQNGVYVRMAVLYLLLGGATEEL